MENASKALIIAGAILLSILLISLGIMVYTNAKGSIGDANLNSEEIQTFNTKISQYCGKNKSANDMNALMSAIIASNGAQKNSAEKHNIGVEVKVKDGSKVNKENYVTGTAPNCSFSSEVKYSAEYETTDGYISKVTVTVPSN